MAGTVLRGTSETPPQRATPASLVDGRKSRPIQTPCSSLAPLGHQSPAFLRPPLMRLTPTDTVDSLAADADAGPDRLSLRPAVDGDCWPVPLRLPNLSAGPFASSPYYTAKPPGAGRAWGGAGSVELPVLAGGRAWSLPLSLEPVTPGPAPDVLGTCRSSAHGLGWPPPQAGGRSGPGAGGRAQVAGVRALLLGFVDSDSDAADVANESPDQIKQSTSVTHH